MTFYLYNVRPGSIELVVEEMLAIKSEIDDWREKKAGKKRIHGIMSCCIMGWEND